MRAADTGALRADCASCVGLCCVALAFSRSADFAIDKEAGEPCPNLAPDHRCTIHARLRTSGFTGCTVYDCLGAGPKVAQVTFGGRSWHDDAATASSMFAAFGVVRGLHELLWYLTQAGELVGGPAGSALEGEARAVRVRVERLSLAPADELAALDGAAVQGEVAALLRRVSTAVRG
ncbi:pentapeptide repeat-containing protein, partial [Actinotalea ferrariae]|nr:pentapeptide repeat-containing protein [Actinotalea ferrariae]